MAQSVEREKALALAEAQARLKQRQTPSEQQAEALAAAEERATTVPRETSSLPPIFGGGQLDFANADIDVDQGALNLGTGVEVAAALTSPAIAEPIAGLRGLAALPQGIGPAVDAIEQTRQDFSFTPRGEDAQDIVTSIAESPITQAIGEGIQQATDLFSERGADLLSPFGLQGEAIGAGAGAAFLPAVGSAAGISNSKFFTRVSPSKTRLTRRLLAETGAETVEDAIKSGDRAVARFMASKGQAVRNPTAVKAIRQGFDEGTVAVINGASPETKAALRNMVDIHTKSQKNARFAARNRPGKVIGESLQRRIKAVRDANRKAGSQIDVEARKLKGQQLDYSTAVDDFYDDLADLDVVVDGGKVEFAGSVLEDNAAAQKVITNLVKRINRDGTDGAWQAHQLKRFIDDKVTYGKNADGLAGQTEFALKSLRRNIDGLLDDSFDAYNQANVAYAETRNALDAFQDVAGSKLDLGAPSADTQIGILSRRVMGNAASRGRVLDSIDLLDSTALKYGAAFQDDLLTQIIFADELDSVFGPAARTSLAGELARTGEQLSESGLIRTAIRKGVEKVQGVDPDAALEAINDLLAP